MAKKKKETTVTIKVVATDGSSPKPTKVTIPEGGRLLAEVFDSQGFSTAKVNIFVNGAQVSTEDLGKTMVQPGANVRVEQRPASS